MVHFPKNIALNLKDYLLQKGWMQVEEALEDDLFLFRHNDLPMYDLVFPVGEQYRDLDRLYRDIIQTLADLYGTKPSQIIAEIGEVRQEVFTLRYYSERSDLEDMSFENTFDILNGIKKMIKSSAISVRHPGVKHSTLNRSEGTIVSNQCRFRHTQEGSFIYKVSCPLVLPNTLFPNEGDLPIERRTFMYIASGLQEIQTAVTTGHEEELVDRVLNNACPWISYNFCEGLNTILNTESQLNLDLGIRWAYSKHATPHQLKSDFSFSYEMNYPLERIMSDIDQSTNEISGVFIGTVERLQGDVGADNKRSGLVKLALLIHNIGKVRVTADLTVGHYQKAIEAHRDTSYIRVKGRLQPTGSKPNRIEAIESFDIVAP